MKIEVFQDGTTTTVRLSGSLDLSQSHEVRRWLLDVLGRENEKQVIVDLSAVRAIDSMGLATLVEALKASRERNIRFVLTGVQGSVKQILINTRLIGIFEVAENTAANSAAPE